jgi:hypothetical protein
MATAGDIMASAQTQLTALQATNAKFDAQIAAIKDSEWNAPLTDQQLKQLTALRGQQQPVLAAIEELSYLTLGALDKSDEIGRIANALAGVVKGLTAQSDKIAAIDGDAKNVSAICTAITKLIPQIQSLAKG